MLRDMTRTKQRSQHSLIPFVRDSMCPGLSVNEWAVRGVYSGTIAQFYESRVR